MKKRYGLLLGALAMGALPSAGLAQPVGRELRVNTYTKGSQKAPSISSDADGTFVVVWESGAYGQDGYGAGVFGQRYDRNENRRLGPEFPVNTYTTDNQRYPAVASDPIGNFVVVWSSGGNDKPEGQDGSSYGIFGQRFAGDGSPLGSEFQVNTYTTERQRFPSVASDAAGNFVVVWTDGSYNQDGQDGSYQGVFGQRFAADGSPLGGEFQVNTYTTDRQRYPAVASDAAGNFVVVWASRGQDGNGDGVFGQRYRDDGSPFGEEFQVNTTTGYSQQNPAVALSESGFVVVWGDYVPYTVGVSGQRFDRDGSRLGTEFRVSRFTEEPGGVEGYGATPQAAYDATGNFIVVWSYHYRSTDFFRSRIFARPYDAGGNPVANERIVNVRGINKQSSDPRVAVDPAGDFVVVWGGYIFDSGEQDVLARLVRGQ